MVIVAAVISNGPGKRPEKERGYALSAGASLESLCRDNSDPGKK